MSSNLQKKNKIKSDYSEDFIGSCRKKYIPKIYITSADDSKMGNLEFYKELNGKLNDTGKAYLKALDEHRSEDADRLRDNFFELADNGYNSIAIEIKTSIEMAERESDHNLKEGYKHHADELESLVIKNSSIVDEVLKKQKSLLDKFG